MKKNVQKLYGKSKGITLIALIITIIILVILAGVTISTLTGENGLLVRAKQAKKAHIQSEMLEQLTLALNELQVDKEGNASLDDVTQEWINTVISKDYNSQIKEDASFDGKMVVMNKNDVTGKFLISQKLEISKTEYNVSTLEFEYETGKLENGKVKILMKITDKVNGITQIDYPNPSEKPLIMNNRKEPVGIDYSVELGKEYKFVITTGDGNKTEKIIKIDDYYYSITKDLGESSVIDNKATKAAYNKTYEATITTEGNYTITGLTVTMDGQNVTTYGNDIVDINTGKIKIEKVTGDIDIKVTTKKLEIQYIAVAVSTSNSASNTSTLNANTQNKGITLYINIIATLEGNKCTAVLKSDNTKAVPYAVNSNGKYTFKVSGTYNNKEIIEEKDVIVNQYKSAQGVVQYDAGDWTEDEINELKEQRLYMINREKTYNSTFNLNDPNSGLNFTFGGFTYKGDTENEEDIESGNIITSRNQSVAPQSGHGIPKYSGWQILESYKKDGKEYIKKIVHVGSPENFVYYYTQNNDAYRAIYLLTGTTSFKKLSDNNTLINTRNWDMYRDKALNSEGYINGISLITSNQVQSTMSALGFYNSKRNTGSSYWTSAANGKNFWVSNLNGYLLYNNNYTYTYRACLGISVIVNMNDGVFAASGSGIEEDPYILGKD